MDKIEFKTNIVYQKDSRTLDEEIKDKIIDVTITSPPYFDLKDYGHKKQIGYGQKYEEYLNDLKTVFAKVYTQTKDNGTLWIIIDSFRRDNEVTPLPFDFSNKLKEVGWKLQEVIIWAKDRTVPWAHQGQMRNLFEYILLFSKKEKYNFYIDEVRDFESLKKWWVKYPERYNPKGKTPDGLWHFDIPTQGSWGNGYIKHFCPLPEEMISQILKISTKENDIVLDPFAGSGAVLAKAENMNRKYIGFELNKAYITMFKNYIKKTSASKKKAYAKEKDSIMSQEDFNILILKLRTLKYAKLLLKKLSKNQSSLVLKIFVAKKQQKPKQRKALIVIEYIFYVAAKTNIVALQKKLQEISKKPPLSKFGVEPVFKFKRTSKSFLTQIPKGLVYTYTSTVTHKFKQVIAKSELAKVSRAEIILTKIKVDLNEKDYE